jgi:hypothetical protein
MIELPEDDDLLAAELAGVLRARDPMPVGVAEAARGAFAWRTIDEDLAVLSLDSLLEATAGVRGGGDRQLTFESDGMSLEVDIVDGGRRVVGQVVPPQAGAVELEGPHTTSSAETDGYGQFSLPVGNGPARLRFRPVHGPSVVTDWVTL